jgi:D-glycero-D-manno-heptose 1,7-bisphosphate phosphatase
MNHPSSPSGDFCTDANTMRTCPEGAETISDRNPGNGFAVFLDRDGVINEEVHFLRRVDQLRLIPGAAEGIRRLNNAGVPVIVVTNQSGIARGLCSERDLEVIHAGLQRMLWSEGARLDAIYYCPHHESADLMPYRRKCPNRKPGSGMLKQAALRHDLDLSRCFLIGDQTVELAAGRNAGCKTVLVETGFAGKDGKYRAAPDYVCADLLAAAGLVLSQCELSLA